MNDSSSFVLRAGMAPYVVVFVVFGILVGLVLAPGFQGRPMALTSGQTILLQGWPATCVIALFPVAFASVFFAGLRAYRVEVREDRLLYRTLVGGTKSIAFAEIAHARFRIGRRTRRGEPFVRLELDPEPGSRAPSLRINLKVLSRADMNKLLARVNAVHPLED
jgi:hypothetical protein